MIIDTITWKYSLYNTKKKEDTINEYKEFFLTKNLNLSDIDDLCKGQINSKTLKILYKSILDYIDKYSIKYILSLSNIDKILLPSLLDHSKSKFYIGISDTGIITGIPIHINFLQKIKVALKTKIDNYYNNFIGLHQNKGHEKIDIGYNTYYDFKKLIPILKKHTKITIHILKEIDKKNTKCTKLLNHIDSVIKEEKEYIKEYTFNKKQLKIKEEYHNKYSQQFSKLIRSDVMIEYRYYCSLDNKIFDKLIFILQCKIKNRTDTNIYLLNGYYIKNSFFPKKIKKELKYGTYFKIFLEEYNIFKRIKLSKKISIKKLKNKNPIKKLNKILSDISCFNRYLYDNKDIIYIMICISLPIIKDKDVYLGYKTEDDIIIVQRSYDTQPYTTKL